jgi:hypothetical protein
MRTFGRGAIAPATPFPITVREELSLAEGRQQYSYALEGKQSWSRADDNTRRAPVLARWRRALLFPFTADAAAFVQKCGERPERRSGQFTLKVSARAIPLEERSFSRSETKSKPDRCVLLDVEVAHTGLVPGALRQLDADAKGLLAGLTDGAKVWQYVDYEFIDLRFPDAVREALDDDVVRSVLRRQDSNLKNDFGSLVVSQTQMRLSVGPEKPGAVLAVGRYVEERLKAASLASYAAFDSKGYRRLLLVPPAMAACLVLSWFLPLNWISTLVWFGVFLALMVLIVWPLWRKVPPQHLFLRARTGSALFLFVVAAFATAYAIADLLDPTVLASDGSKTVGLGNAYLVATGLTFTVGVLTAPLKGLGLQIAHVQMIVFMATIVNVAIAILRLERPGPDQQRA